MEVYRGHRVACLSLANANSCDCLLMHEDDSALGGSQVLAAVRMPEHCDDTNGVASSQLDCCSLDKLRRSQWGKSNRIS